MICFPFLYSFFLPSFLPSSYQFLFSVFFLYKIICYFYLLLFFMNRGVWFFLFLTSSCFLPSSFIPYAFLSKNVFFLLFFLCFILKCFILKIFHSFRYWIRFPYLFPLYVCMFFVLFWLSV